MKGSLNRLTIAVAALLLTGCGSAFPSFSSPDFNADFRAIQAGIAAFETNSRNATAADTLDEYKSIFTANEQILDEIESAVQTLGQHLDEAWNQLPEEDTPQFPARGLVLQYKQGMDNWLSFQRMNQATAEQCFSAPQGFEQCTLDNFSQTLSREEQALSQLRPAAEALIAWSREVQG